MQNPSTVNPLRQRQMCVVNQTRVASRCFAAGVVVGIAHRLFEGQHKIEADDRFH
jgi:hypothetical protein